MSILRSDSLPRIHFDQPVTLELTGAESPLYAQALNLSCGGIFLRTDQLLAEGTTLRLGFELGGRSICSAATVLRAVEPDDPREPSGLALRFDGLAADDLAAIDSYLEQWLRPATEPPVRLRLGELGLAITARPQACWGNFVSVSAELPFLRLGSPVGLQAGEGQAPKSGAIRWVAVQVAPESGVPRLHIGIEVDPREQETGAREQASTLEDSAPPAEPELAAGPFEEETDPVCCSEFVQDSHSQDTRLRANRRQASAAATAS